jgi:hypothetical protein
MPLIQINNINYWGENLGNITQSQREQILTIPSISEQMHFLRHFSVVSGGFKKKVIGQKFQSWNPILGNLNESEIITEELINESLKVLGSKFNGNVKSPESVISLVREYLGDYAMEWGLGWNLEPQDHFKNLIWLKDARENVLSRGKKKYDFDMGTRGVVFKDDLSESEQKRIFTENHGVGPDAYKINSLKVDTLPTTKEVVFQFALKNGRASIATCYPGIMVSTMPNKSYQSDVEFEYNRDYWDSLIFLKETTIKKPKLFWNKIKTFNIYG